MPNLTKTLFRLVIYFLLVFCVIDNLISQSATKTNNTALIVDGTSGTRTVSFASGTDLAPGTIIADLDVSITWTMDATGGFTFHEQTMFFLTSPAGTKVVLVYDVGNNHGRGATIPGSYQGFTKLTNPVTVVFDQAATGTASGSDPVSGTFKPVGSNALDNLDNFNGESPFGTWTLTVADDASDGFGAVNMSSFSVIINDLPVTTPTVELSASANSMNETGGSITLTATLSSAPSTNETIGINYTGVAQQGTDFSGAASITVISGATSGSITLMATGDTVFEGDEAFTATINNTSTATIGTTNSQTITITDDDQAVFAIKIFLEGPLSGGTMSTAISGNTPLDPNDAYLGVLAESAVSSLPSGAVDWLEVELRTGTSAATKVGTNRLAIVRSDGTLVDKDGNAFTMLQADGSAYRIVIHHRNHLSVMSASLVNPSSGTYNYDFTIAQAQTYSNGADGAIQVGSVFAMISGDANDDGVVNSGDLTTWRGHNGSAYEYASSGRSDLNLDGAINSVDRNELQQKNNLKSSQVPSS